MKMKLLLLILLLSAGTVHANRIFKCKTINWNPYFYYDIDAEQLGSLVGSLTEGINGFVGETTTFLGKETLEFRLDPKKCILRILSERNSADEFVVAMPLRRTFFEQLADFFLGNTYTGKVEGTFKGSIYPDQKINCDVKDDKTIKYLKNICSKHSEAKGEIYFKSLNRLWLILRSDTDKISAIKGVSVHPKMKYPRYQKNE